MTHTVRSFEEATRFFAEVEDIEELDVETGAVPTDEEPQLPAQTETAPALQVETGAVVPPLAGDEEQKAAADLAEAQD